MRKIYALIVLSFLASSQIFAQTGELQGKVTDDKTNEGSPFAAVVLELNGTQKNVGETDDDGHYTIKPIVPGTYNIRIILTGYQPVIVTGITVVSDRISFQDAKMKLSVNELPEIFVSTEKLIEPDKTSTGSTLTKDEIEHIATRNITMHR
jgi:hypothetical protein